MAVPSICSSATPRRAVSTIGPIRRIVGSKPRGFWRSGALYPIHGHVHLYDRSQPFQQRFADTDVINVFPYRVLELEPGHASSRSGRRLNMSRPFGERSPGTISSGLGNTVSWLTCVPSSPDVPEISFPITRCGSGCRLRVRATAACRRYDSRRSSVAWTAFRISTASSSSSAIHRGPLAERRPGLLSGHSSPADPALQSR